MGVLAQADNKVTVIADKTIIGVFMFEILE